MNKIVTKEILDDFLKSIKGIFATSSELKSVKENTDSEISSLKESLNNETSTIKENLNKEISSLKESQTISSLQVNGSLKIPTSSPSSPVSGNIWLEL